MRRFWFACLFCLVSFPAFSQIYRVQENAAPVVASRADNPWELSVGVFATTGELHTASRRSVFKNELGFSFRLLYSLNRWASLGVEGGFPRAESAPPAVDEYRVWRAGVAGKFTVTKDTNPRAYIITGVGVIQRRLTSAYWNTDEDSAPYAKIGWGIEAVLSDRWVIGLEAYGLYDTAPQLNQFFSVPHRWTAGAQFQTGFKF